MFKNYLFFAGMPKHLFLSWKTDNLFIYILRNAKPYSCKVLRTCQGNTGLSWFSNAFRNWPPVGETQFIVSVVKDTNRQHFITQNTELTNDEYETPCLRGL